MTNSTLVLAPQPDSDAQTHSETLIRAANYVNGRWTDGGNGGETVVRDKYHGHELARLPHATSAQMEEAISSAVAAKTALRAMSAGERSERLNALAALLEAKQEDLAMLIVREAGKPLSYARAEVTRSVLTVRTAASEAVRFGGEMVPMDFAVGAGRTAFTSRIPIGVIAAITPFNFPLNLVLHKLAPAMAVGCPIVIKPAPQAPLSALALAAMLEEIGWPAGACSVLVTDIPVAEQLVRDERVAMLSFTGSDAVGWHLKSICGKKKVALELGGNASVIVDDDCDLPAAARAIAMGANMYAGQTCISTQRIYAVRPVADALKALLIDEYAKLQAGDPATDGVSVGPLIDRTHFDRISKWVQEATKGGATLLSGGVAVDSDRNVYAATLLTKTKSDMKVNCAEVFGPVAVFEAAEDFGDAIAKVNDSRFGLQAGVFTDRVSHLRRAHAELEVGGVIVNSIPGFRVDSMPYGGIKDSGLGREGLRYAMEEMTEPRLLVY